MVNKERDKYSIIEIVIIAKDEKVVNLKLFFRVYCNYK